MVFTRFKDGYAREGASTYGTTAIADTNATTYLFGVIGQTAVHPSPTTTIEYRATGVSAQEVPAGELWKGVFELTGMYPVGMQNGVLLQAVMGKSVTQDDTPSAGLYTHTITPPTAVDGALPLLPSFTIQHERTGTSSDWATQFLGVKVAALTLTCGFERRYLISKVDWIAKKAEKVAFTLTTDPELPTTENEGPFTFTNMTPTWDVDGTPATIDGLTLMELSISPDFTVERAHTWDSGTYTGQWLRSLMEAPRKKYNLSMTYHPDNSVFFEELIATGNTKKITFKFTRTDTDYILLTLDDCQFKGHEMKTPELGVALSEIVKVEPRTVSFTVVDKITSTHYGG